MVMDKVIDITMFGEFNINNANCEFNKFINHSKKMRMFVEYLILNRHRAVPFSELIENLWGREKSVKSSGALKTMLCRFRNSIQENNISDLYNFIVTKKGCYQLNPDLYYNIDVENFEKLCMKAEMNFDNPEKCLNIYEDVIRLYKGNLLPKSSNESWIIPKRNYYSSIFITAMKNAVYLLNQKKDYKSIIDICKKVLEVDIYDEYFNYQIIDNYIRLEKNYEALKHYNYITKLYYSKLGVQITEEIRDLYAKIISKQKKKVVDIDIIQESLEAETGTRGAFICEFGVFKEIYHLEARCLERSGGTIFMAVIDVESKKDIKNEKMDSIVNSIIGVICKSLRRGDVVSRYSPRQIVLLLPMVNVENGNIVMERIIKTYKRDYPKVNVDITYDIRAVNANSII